MGRRINRVIGRRGGRAAVGAMAAGAAALAAVGAAGAAQNVMIDVVDPASEGRFEPSTVMIAVGDTVTWNFTAPTHNVQSTNTGPDLDWAAFLEPGPGQFDAAPVGYSASFRFDAAGEYGFSCALHPGMAGTVSVADGGEPTPTPTATPTATPTPTPTPVPTPTPTVSVPPPDDRLTPAPSRSAEADKSAPALSRVRLEALKGAGRVSYSLSENATVIVRLTRGKAVVRTILQQARAGGRSVVVRRLHPGRYTVTVGARDAAGNRSAVLSSSARVRHR